MRSSPTPTRRPSRASVFDRPVTTAFTVVLLVLAGALALAACGDDDGTVAQSGDPGGDEAGADESGPTFPAEVEAANGAVTIDARPERIVSLSATATEMLYAIGAGDQVVAVDDYSNYPEGTPMTDLSGLEPNVEAITTYEPDLVVLSFDANDVVAGLGRLDIPVLEFPAAATIDDTYDQITQLGEATGHADEAADVVEDMQAEIEDLSAQAAGAADQGEPLTYYHELDSQLHTATSRTFIGQIYALAGLENVADPADDGSGYPQVSAELLIDADPDLIFLADEDAGVTADDVAARPGWDQITAVRNGDIVELDADVASRWGPRVVELLRTAIKATADAGPGAGS